MDGRKLTRSETDKRVAGVCAGLAEYFGVDPILVRIAFVVLAIMGPGIPLYIVLWIAMPKGEPGVPSVPRGRMSTAVRIAEERFVKGEITAEELSQIRADLTRAR
jgi:phage shock protein PspC (stress-responsive transcriptional regulator)